MTAKYTFEVTHRLTPVEVSALVKDHYPGLHALHARYTPQIDVTTGVTRRPEYLDAIRTSWLLDHPNHRPPHSTLVRALGPALGLLLQDLLGMDWCVIRDQYGETISMVGTDRAGNPASVPPFSYIEAREPLQDGEIFGDLIKLLSETLAPRQA